MRALLVEIDLELVQLALEIDGVPEEGLIEILTAYAADQPLHKRMRHLNMCNGLDLVHLEDTKKGIR